MHPFFPFSFFTEPTRQRGEFDTVHENETGYIFILATPPSNAHHANETGFCFAICVNFAPF